MTSTETATAVETPASQQQQDFSTPAAVFEGLRDFRSLTRERSLRALQDAVGKSRGGFSPEEVEPLALGAMEADAWEGRQGALLATAEMIKAWDRAEFRQQVLAKIPTLLTDKEYRVRKAVACVLRECCRRDGLAIYDGISEVVLGDIRDKFVRQTEEDDAASKTPEAPPGVPAEAPTFLPDTEGWRSLETSMEALEAMMQGCGVSFTPRIDETMLGLLQQCTKHTNRFVREYAYFAFKDAFDVCDATAFLDSIAPRTVELIVAGIRDNWSQVRYAASVAARAFMQKAGDSRDRFYPQLLGNMCLNRHYVAEGVRLFSQETWRFVCGPQGGARLLVAHFDNVIAAYVAAATAPNHAVREAACHCISELAARVAGTPDAPTPFRDSFTKARLHTLLETLLEAFQDESWPVRDVASTALGQFVRAFPDECSHERNNLLELWFDQMADNIPSLRQNGAAALAMATEVWVDELWRKVFSRMSKTLPEVLLQVEESKIFADYTPSGPFSVPKPKPKSLEERAEPEFVDQVMYSCGSVAPKTFRRKRVDTSGCMNCVNEKLTQPWEASEGMVHLLTDLARMTTAGAPSEAAIARADALAGLLPRLAEAFDCSQYRHHHNLKTRVCERLPSLTQALGMPRVLPHLPALLKVVVKCAMQEAHLSLRERALEVLAAWRSALSQEEAEAACKAAEVDTSVLLKSRVSQLR